MDPSKLKLAEGKHSNILDIVIEFLIREGKSETVRYLIVQRSVVGDEIVEREVMDEIVRVRTKIALKENNKKNKHGKRNT